MLCRNVKLKIINDLLNERQKLNLHKIKIYFKMNQLFQIIKIKLKMVAQL